MLCTEDVHVINFLTSRWIPWQSAIHSFAKVEKGSPSNFNDGQGGINHVQPSGQMWCFYPHSKKAQRRLMLFTPRNVAMLHCHVSLQPCYVYSVYQTICSRLCAHLKKITCSIVILWNKCSEAFAVVRLCNLHKPQYVGIQYNTPWPPQNPFESSFLPWGKVRNVTIHFLLG